MQVGLAGSQWDIANICTNKHRQSKRTHRDLKNSSQFEYGTQSSPRPGLPDDVRKWVHFSKAPFLL